MYCEFYGIKKGTPLGDMVQHLRGEHRIKLGTDYWITKNRLGIIARGRYVQDLMCHCPKSIKTIRSKEKLGKKDKEKVLRFSLTAPLSRLY